MTHCPEMPPGLTIGSSRVVTSILWDKMKWLAKAVGAAARIGRTASRDRRATIMRVEGMNECGVMDGVEC